MRLPLAVALVGTVLVLTGCNDEDYVEVPNTREIEDSIELRVIRLPDGREIECLAIGYDGYHFQWTEFDCNWNPSMPPLNG